MRFTHQIHRNQQSLHVVGRSTWHRVLSALYRALHFFNRNVGYTPSASSSSSSYRHVRLVISFAPRMHIFIHRKQALQLFLCVFFHFSRRAAAAAAYQISFRRATGISLAHANIASGKSIAFSFHLLFTRSVEPQVGFRIGCFSFLLYIEAWHLSSSEASLDAHIWCVCVYTWEVCARIDCSALQCVTHTPRRALTHTWIEMWCTNAIVWHWISKTSCTCGFVCIVQHIYDVVAARNIHIDLQ